MSHAGMSGHDWPGAPVQFVAMWMAMMVPMMLPSLVPALRGYYQVVDRPGATLHPARSTAAMAVGYYAVWALVGVAMVPSGAALASLERWLPALAHARPLLVGVVAILAGAVQFSRWKARHLTRCRAMPKGNGSSPARGTVGWRHGVRLGVHCCLSCAGPMAILLAAGVMNPRAMAVATLAITVERLAPDGVRAARALGVLAIAAGLLIAARACVAPLGMPRCASTHPACATGSKDLPHGQPALHAAGQHVQHGEPRRTRG
jgi:predicted metal-binding membrane protein